MPNLVRVFLDPKSPDDIQISQDASGKGQKKQTAQETWTVIFDGVVDKATAANAAGLPLVGRVYNGLFCTRVNPRRDAGSPFVWRVLVDYETRTPQDGNNDGTVWNLQINCSSAPREETATQDRLGLFLTNTFGELLPELPNVTLYDDVYAITWSTSVPPPDQDLNGRTNSDAFSFTIAGVTRSFSKSQAKITDSGWSSDKIITDTSGDTVQSRFVYNRRLTVQVRKPKWVWTAPNEGWRGYNDRDEVATFADPNDGSEGAIPRTSPTKMSLDGHALGKGEEPLKLPDAAIGKTVPSACRTYVEDGAFEIEKQVAMGPLFSKLHD
jgi:hypothetical protein